MSTGVLVDTDFTELATLGALTSDAPLVEGQIQPASVDLRLGAKAYRIQAGFLPGKTRTVAECLGGLTMNTMDLTKPCLFERGAIYLVPLQEGLNLPPEILGSSSPKSSTGRLDIFVRLVTDTSMTYDTVEPGYKGPLYLEIAPLTFPVMLQQGDRLNQLRLHKGDAKLSWEAQKQLHTQTPLLYLNGEAVANPQWISIDTHGPVAEADPIVGYRAKHHTLPINLRNVGAYNWHQFWEPIHRSDCTPLILYPEDFYIFASCEGVCVPQGYAAELVAYDTRVGEIRVHYAGFFDPGWGINPAGQQQGTRAVLEVRAHDVPCVLEHGQPIGRFLYEQLLHTPKAMYGAGIGSNYAGQGLKLAKQFNMAA